MTLQEQIDATTNAVTITPGIYAVSSPVKIPAGKQVLAYGVTIKPSSLFVGKSLVSIRGTGWDLAARVHLSSLFGATINGNANLIGIDTDYTSHLQLRDLLVRGCSTGIVGANAWDLHLCDTFVINSKSCGIKLTAIDRPSNYVRLAGVTVERTSGIALDCLNQVNLFLSQCKLHGVPEVASQDPLLAMSKCDGVRLTDTLFAQSLVTISQNLNCKDVLNVGAVYRMKV